VGVGCRLSKLNDARFLFDTFTKAIPFLKQFDVPRPSGHLIPLAGAGGVPIVGDRVILTGDAAGFVEPFLGEGIYFSILSGQIGANTAVSACEEERYDVEFLQQYRRDCMNGFGKDFEVAYRLACFSYLEQYDMNRVAKFFISEKSVQECMISLMDGTVRYRDAQARLMWPYLKYRLSKLGLPLYNE
jgi:flavin-dependent dehydrogenase